MHRSRPCIDLAFFLIHTSHASSLHLSASGHPGKWAPVQSSGWSQHRVKPRTLWSPWLSQSLPRISWYLRSFSALKSFNVIIYKKLCECNFIILTPTSKFLKKLLISSINLYQVSNHDLHLGLMALPAFPGFFPPSFHVGISPNKIFGCLIPLWHLFLGGPRVTGFEM